MIGGAERIEEAVGEDDVAAGVTTIVVVAGDAPVEGAACALSCDFAMGLGSSDPADAAAACEPRSCGGEGSDNAIETVGTTES